MKKVQKLLIIMLLLAIVIIPIKAYAFTAKVNITPDKQTVSAGDTITLTIKLSDIADLGQEGGINTLGGKISYDKDFFESVSGFFALNDSTGVFAIMSKDSAGVTSDSQEFAVLTAKVKSTAKGNGTISFTDLSMANGGNDAVASEDINLNFSIPDGGNSEEPDNNTTPGNTTGNTTENTTGNTTDNVIENIISNIAGKDNIVANNITGNTGITSNNYVGNKNDNTLSSKIIPNTGIKAGIVIFAFIVLAMGISSYILYRRYRNI